MSMQILAAFLQQETNTFSDQPSTWRNFETGILLFGDEIARARKGTATDWGALFEAATARDWALVTPLYAHAQPSGLLDGGDFERLVEPILAAWTDECAGAILMLHGSMVADGVEDCEGELLARLRRKTGHDVPIVVTLDPHANVTRRMADAASAIVAYRTTPHVDQVDTTRRAVALMAALLGRPRPHILLARPPTLVGLDAGRTIQGAGPMVEMLRQAAEAECDPGVLALSVHAGFSLCDTPEVGPSVAMTVVAPTPAHRNRLSAMVAEIWRTRASKTIAMTGPGEAMRLALASRGDGPAMVVDYADNPGGGAPGDDVALLGELLERDPDRSLFFSIADPAAVIRCRSAGIGATLTLDLGGRSRAAARRGPLRMSAAVVALTDGRYVRQGPYFTGSEGNLGASALVRVGSVLIVVTSVASQIEEREQLRLFGLEAEALDVIACKAMNHFRADYEPIARTIVYTDAGGICSPDPLTRTYARVSRPIWPLDPEAACLSGPRGFEDVGYPSIEPPNPERPA